MSRLQSHTHCARPQFGRYGQQGSFALIRAFPIFLNLSLIQRHHLPQAFFKQGLCFLRFAGVRSSGRGRLFLPLRRASSRWRRRFRLSEDCVALFR